MDEFNLSEGLYIRVASLEIQARKSMRLGAQAITRCETLNTYLSPLSLIFLIYKMKIIFTSYIFDKVKPDNLKCFPCWQDKGDNQ